jgi:hypothetical protein
MTKALDSFIQIAYRGHISSALPANMRRRVAMTAA